MKLLRLHNYLHLPCSLHICNLMTLSNFGPYDEKTIPIVQHHYDEATSSASSNRPVHSSSAEVFRMVLPPPNVTGNLHIGHAITVALEDAICRYQRLLGKKVCWTPGFDHAGMATQQVVERQLLQRFGKRPAEMSKAEFIAHCEEWKEARIRDISAQLRSLGCSLDWSDLFYTMDQKFARAVRVAFCRLHSLGLIVRETRPVFPVLTSGDKNKHEPVMMEQWFLHMDGMNKQLGEDFEAGKFNFTPSMTQEITEQFTKFKDPWNLSRQIVWGHRIPAYFVEKSKRWIVAESEAEARAQLAADEMDSPLLQDPDVLDTWFSSSLIPIVIAGWPDRPICGQSLELMETGHDIVGHWVAKMMMLCHRLTGDYPFTRVLLHGMVRDNRERKMSKSLGNVVDPLDIIRGISLKAMVERVHCSILASEEKAFAEADLRKRFPRGMRSSGVDVFRFSLLQHDLTKAVLRVDFTLPLTEARNFCNRVWNLCKFTQNVFKAAYGCYHPWAENAERTVAEGATEMVFEAEDIELKRQLALATRAYHCHMQALSTNHALQTLRDFIGNRVNNEYLEFTKSVLQAQPTDARRLRAIAETLREVVATSLGLLQPFLPQLCTFLQDALALDAQAAVARALHDAVEYEKGQKMGDGKEREEFYKTEEKQQSEKTEEGLLDKYPCCF